MPALVTGANAANRDVIYIGISGDGDSLSIGLGHLCHAIRRNVNVLYLLENNGVYGLDQGAVLRVRRSRLDSAKRGRRTRCRRSTAACWR